MCIPKYTDKQTSLIEVLFYFLKKKKNSLFKKKNSKNNISEPFTSKGWKPSQLYDSFLFLNNGKWFVCYRFGIRPKLSMHVIVCLFVAKISRLLSISFIQTIWFLLLQQEHSSLLSKPHH